jgi:hypothetical protein
LASLVSHTFYYDERARDNMISCGAAKVCFPLCNLALVPRVLQFQTPELGTRSPELEQASKRARQNR